MFRLCMWGCGALDRDWLVQSNVCVYVYKCVYIYVYIYIIRRGRCKFNANKTKAPDDVTYRAAARKILTKINGFVTGI